ncbi:MAG: TerC family protein [Beijerinckiaceae bacterium]|nr:TerC family protein [Beijerinckiaceae bacterium]
MESLGPDLLKLVQIIWINIILSGDNAVVIALACRGLPADKQRSGMIIGALVAVVLRIVFTVAVATLLSTPFLKIIGGLLLLWIAVKLVRGEEEGGDNIQASDRLFHAVKTIAIADMVMSLDNVLAIAAVAKDSVALLIVGLAISIPLIVAGAALIMRLLARFPLLVWAGAGLLGWVAGEMLITDPWLVKTLGEKMVHTLELPVAAIGAVFVVGLGYILNKMSPPHKDPVEREA